MDERDAAVLSFGRIPKGIQTLSCSIGLSSISDKTEEHVRCPKQRDIV